MGIRSASRARNASINQHQVAREEWSEGKRSNKPRCRELREHHAQTNSSTSKSTSTSSSDPRTNVHPECYTLDEAQLELKKSEMNQTTNSEDKDKI